MTGDSAARPPLPPDDAVLVADSIGKSFGATPVLTSATMWAWPGRITAMLGRNGTGKTTLLRVGAGVLRPTWGVVRYREGAVERARLHRQARRGLFYLPQDGLMPRGFTAREMALALIEAFGLEGVDLAAWTEGYGLGGLLDRPRHHLSGGERNRIGMALAVLRGPTCLLADEPLTGSAPADRALVTAMLADLRDRGCAVVVTGHETRDLLDMADRVIWMVAGSTRDMGTPAEARRSHQFVREYLGPRVRE